jgi:hypothetical protein
MSNKDGHVGFIKLKPAIFAINSDVRQVLIGLAIFCIVAGVGVPTVLAAENLRLRDGISFYQDIDSGFPIKGENMDDVIVGNGKPSIVFFGASDDLNTNRQAKRLVDLYYQLKDTQLKFIPIDVDHPPNRQACDLIKMYYRGYIPAEVVFDSGGKQVWSQIGEVENRVIVEQLHKVLQL